MADAASTRSQRRSGSTRTGRGRACVVAEERLARGATELAAAGDWTLLGLWGEAGARAHGAARRAARPRSRSSASTARTGAFRRSARMHPPAIRLERAIRDLYGLEPDGRAGRAALARSRPLGRAPAARRAQPDAAARATPYAFLPAEGEGLHQIPVGPVHAGIIEPGHFRFTANGETVVRLEERLGYVHKGIEALMAGADARAGGAARRPRLRRQHGRLCARLRPRRRGRARRRGAAARASGCAR